MPIIHREASSIFPATLSLLKLYIRALDRYLLRARQAGGGVGGVGDEGRGRRVGGKRAEIGLEWGGGQGSGRAPLID